MIADFDDFVTWMFVIIDDLWQPIAPLYRRPGPEPTSCSDSELMTMAIISECRGWDRETHAQSEWAAYRELTEQFGVEQNYAHSFWGLCARLYTKLTAHTLCLYLNRLLGNPDWLQIKGLAFPQPGAG